MDSLREERGVDKEGHEGHFGGQDEGDVFFEHYR